MQSRLVVCSLVLFVQFVTVLPVRAAQTEPPAGYTVTAIPIPDGFNDVQAGMINSKSTAVGMASGYDSAGSSAFYPILYQNGKLKFLGGDGVIGNAIDVNNRGKIVGFVSPDGISGGTVPVLLATDGYTELGSLGGDGGANAINGSSQVVGYSYTGEGSDSPVHAFFWEEGDITDLGELAEGGSSNALDINDDGLIAGAATEDAGIPIFSPGTHAVIWQDGEITDLGALEDGDLSIAFATNASGQVIGSSTTTEGAAYGDPGMQGFLWEDGEMTALPLPDDSNACLVGGINKQGWVTGSCTSPGGNSVFGSAIAVLWIDGEVIDLTSLVSGDEEWVIQRAFGINDAGQIVAVGYGDDGAARTLILTPTEA